MSPEAQLLDVIDTLGTAVSSGDARTGEIQGLMSQILSLSNALDLAEAAAAARLPEWDRLESLARGDVERLMDGLAGAANAGLERRLAGPDAGESPEAPPPGFAEESADHLETIERQLLALEKNPGNPEPIHAIFRGFHTIKGLASIFHAPTVRDLAHEVESMLDRVRIGLLQATPELIDTALRCADALRSLIGGSPLDTADLIKRIHLFNTQQVEEPAVAAVQPEAAASASPCEAANTIKVDTAKLDDLVDLVGEVVIAQSLVESDLAARRAADPRLARNLGQLARMIGQLQKSALRMRLVPLGPLFQRLARALRDLTRLADKQATLEMSGAEIELDRTLLEQLADPLMHMVRNAIDHGLEPPAERAAMRKPPAGVIRLEACHRGGQVEIAVSDDGRGLDAAKILRRAIARGIVKPDAALSTGEILELIFLPGFSTAETVTGLSGRGVGMDVVRWQIEKLRGRVEIQSAIGVGTTFRLRLPLTLAIIDGLLVRSGGARYVLPLFAVREMFRPPPGSVKTIEGRTEVAVLRDRAIPMFRLGELTGVPEPRRDPYESVLVVAQRNGRDCCLLVDSIEGKQEVVIKSLGDWIGYQPGISGGAILDDGNVGLILDLDPLLSRSTESLRA